MAREEALRERNEQLEREIAKRQQAEEDLREMQGFLASLLEHAPISIYVASTDGRLRLVNRAWEEFQGLSRKEAIGRQLEQIYPAEVARQYIELNQRVVDAAAPIVTEEIGDAPDGRHYFHTVKFPLRNPGGEVEAVGGVSIDVTERKQAEQALRKRNLELELLNRAARAFSSTLDFKAQVARSRRLVSRFISHALERRAQAQRFPWPGGLENQDFAFARRRRKVHLSRNQACRGSGENHHAQVESHVLRIEFTVFPRPALHRG